MKILVADDEPVSRLLLENSLSRLQHQVVTARDGREAWEILDAEDAPQLAVLDWSMPEIEGIELCRRLQARQATRFTYSILVTAHTSPDQIAEGLESGADDYIVKPFKPQELRARIRAAERIIELQTSLKSSVDTLQVALGRVRELEGILSICMHCKRIRDEEERWQRLEVYIEKHSRAMFSHALCQQCMEEHYPE